MGRRAIGFSYPVGSQAHHLEQWVEQQKPKPKHKPAGLVLLIFGIIILVFTFYFRLTDKTTTELTTITVNQGDTLWSIAESYCPNEDPRKVIYEIGQANHLGEYLLPGEVLIVPQEITPLKEASR